MSSETLGRLPTQPRRWALLLRAFEWFTHKRQAEPRQVREARLLTLIDTPLVFTLSVCWSQAPAWMAWLITRQSWILGCVAADLSINAFRVVFMFRHRTAVKNQRRPPHAQYALVTVCWLSILALSMVALLGLNDVRVTVVASFVPIGFGGYIASRMAAFPCLGFLCVGIVISAMTLGLLRSPVPELWVVGLLAPGAAVAYCLLMWQNHAILLGALHAQHENRCLSLQDALTGLPNRLALREGLLKLIQPSVISGAQAAYALLYLDLDGFKGINDCHGHAAGDLLLKSVAGRMRSALRLQDIACRTGGDEFVILLPEADRDIAVKVAERLIRDITQGHDLGDASLAYVGVSVGIALGGMPHEAPDALLARADSALYAAKRDGKGTWRIAE